MDRRRASIEPTAMKRLVRQLIAVRCDLVIGSRFPSRRPPIVGLSSQRTLIPTWQWHGPLQLAPLIAPV